MTPVSPDRRLVLLTGNGPEHRYLANRLCAALPIAAIVTDMHARPPSLRRAFRGSALGGVSRIGLYAFRKLVRDQEAQTAALRQILGEELTAQFPAGQSLLRIDGVNSQDAIDTVKQIEPDAMLVFGTSIVGPQMLSLANDLAFNLHTGISPRYRGTDCTFWPVVNREPEWLGATVHECTADVDGGAMFETTRASWSSSDQLHDLFARAVACGADLYISVVQRYLRDGAISGEPQDLTSGREYRGYMRTLMPELRARWALRRGLLSARVGSPPAAPLPDS